jgi:hypothetical protein
MHWAGVGEFFYLQWADEWKLALGQAPRDPGLENLDRRLRMSARVDGWTAPAFDLTVGTVVDYLANSMAFRLCSQRLRDAIDRSLSALDLVQWLPVVVRDRKQTELPYWAIHFPEPPNVINMSKSVLYFPDPKVVASRPVLAMDSPKPTDPVIVKACLDANLVAGRRFFGFRNDSVHLIVADDVKNEIERAECSGMKFSRVPVG